MDKNTQNETGQSGRNACLENPVMFWKDWDKLMPSNVFNDTAKSWLASAGLPFNDQSTSINDSLQKITQYLEFNAKQQKIFLDWSNAYMDYLTVLGKNHRESRTNGGDQMKCLNGDLAACKELMKSFVSLMDGHMENISKLYEASCAAKKQPAEKSR